MPKVWKSELNRGHGVWTSEVRLTEANADRIGKVKKLLALLKDNVREDTNATIP